MPGSLSNEDEGQDDMDFEDDLPGEERGEAGCPSHYFAPLRLECGEKGLSRARRGGGGGGVGCNKQSHANVYFYFFSHDLLSRWERVTLFGVHSLDLCTMNAVLQH